MPSPPLDPQTYDWFLAQAHRFGSRQALHLLLVTLGVDPRWEPYVQAYWDWEAEQGQLAMELLTEEEARLDQIRFALEARGLDHITWTCPASAERECRMWESPHPEPIVEAP